MFILLVIRHSCNEPDTDFEYRIKIGHRIIICSSELDTPMGMNFAGLSFNLATQTGLYVWPFRKLEECPCQAIGSCFVASKEKGSVFCVITN